MGAASATLERTVVVLPRGPRCRRGHGLLASLLIRRTTDEPFDVRFGFDTATTGLYGRAGQPLEGPLVGGRLVFEPSSTPSAP